jgi:hypothetical protein
LKPENKMSFFNMLVDYLAEGVRLGSNVLWALIGIFDFFESENPAIPTSPAIGTGCPSKDPDPARELSAATYSCFRLTLTTELVQLVRMTAGCGKYGVHDAWRTGESHLDLR